MAYEPLHHKYRPQTFADLVGQEAIAKTLSNALKLDKIAPAYLLTGARGTGKTSTARIMAKSLNCIATHAPTATPCGTCDMCFSINRSIALDITEIDAASNTGVDNIRELIERAQFAPVQARYKVYIIDEVHMLSNAAFNALLKTLEEPPDRVVFILATTDPQRVLPTIISRCQKFDFRRIPLEAMSAHLQKIARLENININDEAVMLVAQIAQGGLRDAESLLDQLSLLEGEINVEAVWDLVGSVPEKDLLLLLEAIATSNSTLVIDQLRHIMDRGREPLIVLQNLASAYRDLLIAQSTPERSDLTAFTIAGWEQLKHLAHSFSTAAILAGQQHLRSAEVQIKNSTQPRLWLEVTVIGLLTSSEAAIQSHSDRIQPNQAYSNGKLSSLPVQPIANGKPSITTPPPISQLIPSDSLSEDLSTNTTNKQEDKTVVAFSENKSTSVNLDTKQDIKIDSSLVQAEENLSRDRQVVNSEPIQEVAELKEVIAEMPEISLPELEYTSISATELLSEPTPTLAKPIPTPTPISPPKSVQVTNEPQVSTVNLDRAWQEIISLLAPAPKGLLAEHGNLIGVDGNHVRISIRNTTIKKIADQKRDDIAKVCQQVFKRSLQVVFEVSNAKNAVAKLNTEPNSRSQSLPSASKPSTYTPPPPNPSSYVTPSPVTNDQPIAQSEPISTPNPIPTNSASMRSSPEYLALKNVADFFQGQIIDLDAGSSTEE